MKFLLLLALSLAGSTSYASYTTRISFLGYSYHFISEDTSLMENQQFNRIHNTLVIEHRTYFVGYFENSYYEDTFVVGKTFYLSQWGDFRAALRTGVSYGYRDCFKGGHRDATHAKRVCAAVVPEITYTEGIIYPTISLVGSAISLSFEYEW